MSLVLWRLCSWKMWSLQTVPVGVGFSLKKVKVFMLSYVKLEATKFGRKKIDETLNFYLN